MKYEDSQNMQLKYVWWIVMASFITVLWRLLLVIMMENYINQKTLDIEDPFNGLPDSIPLN
jgi:hypothetical protein